MVGREANKVPSGDTGESQSQASHLETKPRAGGVAQRLPGPEGRRRGRRRGLGHEPQRAEGGRAGKSGSLSPRSLAARLATSPRAPTLLPRRGADAARTTSPRKPRGRRGAEPGAIPRDPARWEAPRRTQRPEGGERAGGRGEGGGGADVGQSPACQGGGRPGWRHWEAGSAACTAPAARSRLGGRRTAGSAHGPSVPSSAARSTRTHTEAGRPERRGHCPGAGPRPRSSERGGCLGFNGCSEGQRLGVEAAAAQEGARASLLWGWPRPPRRAPWGPADPGRRGPLARRPRVPAMN